ncbi:serine/threonine-protein kinase RsbT [Streptomyces zhaozhouensis]|uniref:Serine/threonine-protein kinase RsbT n=1 Tax=Streptomyces zhaozhouensis TaxID=1300267 RepID=A0A286DI38_9ACTN|nr:serine/threonine-protein kinase RsbT [Streptomyces zhaozhouensis]
MATMPDEPSVRLASRQAPPFAGPPGPVTSRSEHPVRVEEDLMEARHAVRAAALAVDLGLVDQTRVVTAASELVRNAYIHGGGGVLVIEQLSRKGGRGIRLTVSDEGPGIPDLDAALNDGFSTGAGLGHGLGGARRLMHEFDVECPPGGGTTVRVTRWATG